MGQYFLRENVQIGSLRMFLRIGHTILPRYLFYAVLLTTALAVYGVLGLVYEGRVEITTVTFGVVGAVISWYECLRMWKERVF